MGGRVLQRSERLLEGGVGFELVSENQIGKRKTRAVEIAYQ